MREPVSDDSSFFPGPQLTQEAFPPVPLCWPALTEEEREEQLDALADWTRWLVDRYALDHRTVPPCWSQHGALLEELSALRTAWLTAYAVTSTGDAPLEWHAHFAAARQRLAEWVSRIGCRSGEHREQASSG